MCEAWAKHLWGDDFDVYSAGIEKQNINKRAVKVMEEEGVDLTFHFSKTIDEIQFIYFDYVITVCDDAHEKCPYFPASKIIHHGFEDPPRLTENLSSEEEILIQYRRVRDQIKEMIKNLPPQLD
jgi:arsenate reductase